MAAHWQIVLTLLTAFGVAGAIVATVPARPTARDARRTGRRYVVAAVLIVGATAAATVWLATAH